MILHLPCGLLWGATHFKGVLIVRGEALGQPPPSTNYVTRTEVAGPSVQEGLS